MCPVCTIGVAAGIGLSRYLGVDDLISGIWIGALLIYLTLWTSLWLNKKNISKIMSFLISFIVWYALVLIPLKIYNFIGQPLNKIYGIDKLLIGIVIGSIFLPAGIILSEFIKKKNNNRTLFPFQKVVIPISVLVVISLIIYLLL
ncbi:MAG: hypothetical protein QXG91_03910 [Candidatus Aenigmatarchaeota archaeon]